jgi:uncharacterized damage-inducible protein DinB
MKVAPFLFLAACALPAYSQSNPIPALYKSQWSNIKNLVIRAAEKMPEEAYGFKPSDDVRTFGQMVAHIGDAQGFFCGAINGEQKNFGIEKGKTSKTEIVAALKEALAFCDRAYERLNEENVAGMIRVGQNERPMLAPLLTNLTHTWEHYGNLVTYMRMKGVVPPSSEPRR